MQLWIIQFLWNIPRCLPRLLYALASHDSLLIRYHLCYITFKDTHAFTELDGYSSKLCDKYKLDANFKKSTHTYMPRCYELKKQERWKKLSPYPAKTYIHKINKFIIFPFSKPSQVLNCSCDNAHISQANFIKPIYFWPEQYPLVNTYITRVLNIWILYIFNRTLI